MGETRVIFTDATTAEAITILKSAGFLETADGGCFLSDRSPIKVYSVWGKAPYYPDLLSKVSFTSRIQVHFKCKDQDQEFLDETVRSVAQGLVRLCDTTKIMVFDANTCEEISPAVMKP